MALIGKWVVFLEEENFNGKTYKKGHKFKVTGDDDIRGLDLEDADGNKIGETRFIRHKYEFIDKIREDKLKELGI